MAADDAGVARRVLELIDLTLLGDDDTGDDVTALCRAALTPWGPVAAVCVWPRFVGHAVALLSGTGIGVAAVANFPGGQDSVSRVAEQARRIVDAGASEVDVVVPWHRLRDGEHGASHELVSAVRAAVGDDIVIKAILETGELEEPPRIRTIAHEALGGGADMLKTSTGKTPRGASVDAAIVLLDVIVETGGVAGLKVSGGVRSVQQARAYLDEADRRLGADWATPDTFRFGASALLEDVAVELSR